MRTHGSRPTPPAAARWCATMRPRAAGRCGSRPPGWCPRATRFLSPSRTTSSHPTASGCWSSPIRERSGGTTPAATTGCSTSTAARCASWAGASAKEATLMFAKFSPDGSRVGYVRENNLYVEDLASATITRLTPTARARRSTARSTGSTRRSSPARRVALEPGRQADRLLAARRHRRARLHLVNNTDSLYSTVVSGPVPQGRHHQLRPRGSAWFPRPAARRCGWRCRATRATTTSPRMEWAAGIGRGGDPAPQPAPEHASSCCSPMRPAGPCARC